MKFLERLTSFIAWFQILLSPLILGVVTGLVVYKIYPTTIGLVVAITLPVTGLTAGIILATRISKKQGTVEFMSKVSATPELDKLIEDKQ